jgi:Flp pilus assembly protein protease CpaA
MINLNFLFIPLILALGIITSYTDIKEGKIRNKHLIIISVLGLFLYIIFFFIKQISLQFIFLTLVNLGIGALIGIFLWFLGFWSAGDAKLFSVYLLIIPLIFYKIKTYTYLFLLLNVIIPVTVYYICVLLFKTTFHQKRIILLKYVSPRYLINTFLIIFSIGWLAQLLLNLIRIPSNFLLSMFLVMILDLLIRKIWRFPIIFCYILVSITRIAFHHQEILNPSFLLNFLFFSLGYMILRSFIFDASFQIYSTPMNTKDLKPGMILAENVITQKDKKTGNIGQKVSLQGLFTSMQIQNKNFLLNQSVEGLTQKNIETMKKNNIDSIKIQQTIPFAPFMFAGALIICLFGLDIVNIIYQIIIK